MPGITADHLTISQSPDGSSIMLGYREADQFTWLGLLDPMTGVLKMMTREVPGGSEYFWGFLNTHTLALTALDEFGNYSVYAYTFREAS